MEIFQNGKELLSLKRAPLTVLISISQRTEYLFELQFCCDWESEKKKNNCKVLFVQFSSSVNFHYGCVLSYCQIMWCYYNTVYIFQTTSEWCEIRIQEINYSRKCKVRIRHTGYMQLNLKDELLPQSVLKMSCLSTTTFVQGVYEYVHYT